MARQRVEAPSTRIQRNLLSPVDTYFQTKTGVVVQPGEKSDGLKQLVKALGVAQRDTKEWEKKWNKEQQTLGTKAAMEQMAKGKNIFQDAEAVHPDKSYQFQMAYDSKVGEMNALNFATKMDQEWDKMKHGTILPDGTRELPDFQKFLSEKVGQKLSTVGDNQFYIGGFNKYMNQWLPQKYAQGAAIRSKLRIENQQVVTDTLNNGIYQNPSKTWDTKIRETFTNVNKQHYVGNKEKREQFLKGLIGFAEGNQSEDVLEELIKITKTKSMMMIGTNQPFTLTPVEEQSIERAITGIINSKRSDERYKNSVLTREIADGRNHLNNIVDDHAHKDPITYLKDVRKNLQDAGYTNRHVSDADIFAAQDQHRNRVNNSLKDNRSPTQKVTEMNANINIIAAGNPNNVDSLLQKLVNEGKVKTPTEFNQLHTLKEKIRTQNSWLKQSYPKDWTKNLGRDDMGQPTGYAARLQTYFTQWMVDLDLNVDRKLGSKTYDIRDSEDVAHAFRTAQAFAVNKLISEDAEIQNIMKGQVGSGKSLKEWTDVNPLGGNVSPKMIFDQLTLLRAGVQSQTQGSTQGSLNNTGNNNNTSGSGSAGGQGGNNTTTISQVLQQRRNTAPPPANNPTNERPAVPANVQNISEGQWTPTGINLTDAQLQAAAKMLAEIIEQPITNEGAYTQKYVRDRRADELKARREKAILEFFKQDYGWWQSADETKKRDSLVSAVMDYFNVNAPGFE